MRSVGSMRRSDWSLRFFDSTALTVLISCCRIPLDVARDCGRRGRLMQDRPHASHASACERTCRIPSRALACYLRGIRRFHESDRSVKLELDEANKAMLMLVFLSIG